MDSSIDLNLNQYQKILFEEDKQNPYKSADIQRKCLSQIVQTSYNRLPNVSTCDILESELNKYYSILYQSNENIYQTRLKELLRKSNKDMTKNFKSNLGILEASAFLKPLECCNKNYCIQSESFNEGEFSELCEVFSEQKAITKITTDQQLKFSKPETKYAESHTISRKTNDEAKKNFTTSFKTAKDELYIQNVKKYGYNSAPQTSSLNNTGQKRKLGTRRNINSKFISPLLSNNGSQEDLGSDEWPSDVDERLKNIDPKMVELIKAEIMDSGANIHWDDISGLSFAKTAIQEAVVWPMLRPDIFTGLRRPPKGILLFGPPGTGKTLIGRCVASQSKSTFFSISASSLTSKWVGDGEKMVRALFIVARVHQPSVIFIDEIDSLLSQRSDSEHESSRRIKTEFLVQLDGATTDNEERILVIGATNRPQELDEAARRRFVKRLYIPLPEFEARLQLVQKLISSERHQLREEDFHEIATLSDGYSGADIRNLCSEASLGPIRSIDMSLIEHIQAAEVRPLLMEDFSKAFNRVRSSVSPKDLEQYIAWDGMYGSGF